MRPGWRTILVLAALLGARGGPVATAADVQGSFRLLRTTYVVGEPVVVEFSLTSAWDCPFLFSEGGDYRGTLRHARFSFRVTDGAGRDFTGARDEHEGGEVREIVLAPTQAFRSWQLLNGWTHLLPPGNYRVHCERTLALDTAGGSLRGLASRVSRRVAADLSFEVTPYARARIVSAIAELHALDVACRDDVETFFGVPVEWAVADVRQKLELGPLQLGNGAVFERAVLDALPERWDDRRYVAYGFRENRNWVTRGAPEAFELTLTARNDARVPLPHRLEESTLLVNGTPVPRWPERVRELLAKKRRSSTLAPGAVVELTISCDDLVPPRGTQSIAWTLGPVQRTTELRVGR